MLQVLTPRRKKPEYAEPVKPIEMPAFQAKTEFTSKATESIGSFQVGTVVEHPKFGEGTVKTLLGAGQDLIAVVDFPEYGEKKMFLSFAPLKIKG